MVNFIRSIFALGLSAFLFASTAAAQESAANENLTINDIAGSWRIEVIDRPKSHFKGSAQIPRADGNTVMAETITEDKCCNGKNHARVLQDSRITITNGEITIKSKIREYLIRNEEVDSTYHSDDFYLRRENADTLIGTVGRYLPVRWVRDEPNIG